MEQWKDVVGYEDLYVVSDKGRVKNKTTNIILKPSLKKNNYYSVCLCNQDGKKHISIHRIVALAFVENPYNLPIVNHKDENKLNNRADNLEWCTYQYNNTYGQGSLKRRHGVIQYDMAGNAIRIWNSLQEASEETNVPYQSISACCRGEYNSSGGYMWSYSSLDSIRKYSHKDR